MVDIPKNWKRRQPEKKNLQKNNPGRRDSIINTLLENRGIEGKKAMDDFLNPKLSSLNDPGKLPNINKASKRILESIYNKERVLVYGDYDVDGIMSTVMMHDFYKMAGIEADMYIPNRFEEGYGIVVDFIKSSKVKGKYDLIVCVDCGTNAREVRDYINSDDTGMDIIVSDHHQEDIDNKDKAKESKKFIIVNPNIQGSKYPFKNLSGAGVTFKLITHVLRNSSVEVKKSFDKSFLTKLLDITAVATIADLMPLIDENRIIAKFGMQILSRTNNPGLGKLIDKIFKEKENIKTFDISFILAPRLNASGRIKNANIILRLLTKEEDHLEIIKEIEKNNKERRDIQEETYRDIIEEIEYEEDPRKSKVIIRSSKYWHEGVLGIIASKLQKKYNVPVILFTEKEGYLKGSGRSIDCFDLYRGISRFKDLFERFGGHRKACGITIKKENYDAFKKSFIDSACKDLNEDDITRKVIFDLEIDFSNIDFKLLRKIEKLEPFGIGNPVPSFLTKKCIIQEIKFLKDKKHVSLLLRNSEKVLDGIMFNISKDLTRKLKVNKEIDLIYNIEKNNWKNNNIQLKIIDIFIRDGRED